MKWLRISVKNAFDIWGKYFSYLRKWLYLLPLKTFAWDDWEHFWEILLGIFLIPYEIFHAGSQFVILRVNLSNVLRNICQRIWFKAGMTLNVILMKQEVIWRQMVPFFLHTFKMTFVIFCRFIYFQNSHYHARMILWVLSSSPLVPPPASSHDPEESSIMILCRWIRGSD